MSHHDRKTDTKGSLSGRGAPLGSSLAQQFEVVVHQGFRSRCNFRRRNISKGPCGLARHGADSCTFQDGGPLRVFFWFVGWTREGDSGWLAGKGSMRSGRRMTAWCAYRSGSVDTANNSSNRVSRAGVEFSGRFALRGCPECSSSTLPQVLRYRRHVLL